jgi:predicted anti-sigma-YlaC factor YlaD
VSGIIDGRQWLEQRQKHLQAELDAGPPDDRRAAIEAELERVRAEVAAGRRRRRRWLLWGGRAQP